MSDAIWISPEHGRDRLGGTLANLMRGAGQASIEFYDGTRPAGGGAVTNLVALVLLADPPGEIESDELVLFNPADSIVLIDATATWARWYTGEGNASMDWTVVEAGAPVTANRIVLERTDLLAGGGIRIISARILS